MSDDGRFLALGVIGLVAAAGLVRRGSRGTWDATFRVWEPRLHEGTIDLTFEVDPQDEDDEGIHDAAMIELDANWDDIEWDRGEPMEKEVVDYKDIGRIMYASNDELYDVERLEPRRRSLRDLWRQR